MSSFSGVVSEIAAGGEGVLPVLVGGERRVVFVPRAAVGDEIVVTADPRERPMRPSSVRVVVASPDRREPPCTVADRCGGCPLMHLSPEARRRARAGIVERALAHVVSLDGVDVTHHDAPADHGYRTRARLAVVKGKLGHREGRSRDVVRFDACLVLAAPLSRGVEALRPALARERVLEVHLGLGAAGTPVVTVEGPELSAAAIGALDALVGSGAFGGVEIRLEGASRPMRIGAPEVVTVAADGGPLVLAPGGFAQANPEVSRQLARLVLALAKPEGARVVELFAGAGNLTTSLAKGAASCTAVEVDEVATHHLRRNLAARGLEARIVTADADAFPIPKRTDVVVLDPPRRGAKGAVAHVVAAAVSRVVYVSCDPPTLARDVAALAAVGYRLRGLATFDMFPETAHVESVAWLDR